jgi:hypothetical protein
VPSTSASTAEMGWALMICLSLRRNGPRTRWHEQHAYQIDAHPGGGAMRLFRFELP